MTTETPVGEYRPEMMSPSTKDWVPIPTLDPVPDREDMATERDAHTLRMAVAKMNKQNQHEGVAYRVRYVPA